MTQLTHPLANVLPWFSASKVKAFETCKQQYISKYLLHMPQTLTTYGVVGTAVHRAIQFAYSQGVFPYDTAEHYIRNEYATTYADKSYIGWNETEALNRAFMMLDNVPYDDYQYSELEKEFLVPFPLENPICMLHGFIDMVTQDEIILDWKTSSKLTKKECLTQGAIYYYAHLFLNYVPPTKVVFYHLPQKRVIVLDEMEMIRKLGEVQDTILEMIAMSATTVERCNSCSLFCPLYLQTAEQVAEQLAEEV